MVNPTLFSISGAIKTGKDTVGQIIQYLIYSQEENNLSFTDFQKRMQEITTYSHKHIAHKILSGFKIRKFATIIKNMVCLLLNCTLEQLEDREFKEKELGEEWWYYKIVNSNNSYSLFSYLDNKNNYPNATLIKLTPRLLFQLLGTDCGRDIIHPNIWVNALFSTYQKFEKGQILGNGDRVDHIYRKEASKWIITDTRFPNELQAVKSRGGISIKVERWIDKEYTKLEAASLIEKGEVTVFGIDYNNVESEMTYVHDLNNYERFVTELERGNHESETALDGAEFDYVLDNNGSIPDLIEQVRSILTELKIIKRT
jgi:hypothetical protein